MTWYSGKNLNYIHAMCVSVSCLLYYTYASFLCSSVDHMSGIWFIIYERPDDDITL